MARTIYDESNELFSTNTEFELKNQSFIIKQHFWCARNLSSNSCSYLFLFDDKNNILIINYLTPAFSSCNCVLGNFSEFVGIISKRPSLIIDIFFKLYFSS